VLTKDFNGDGILDQHALSGSYISMSEGFVHSNGARYLHFNEGKLDFGLFDPNAIKSLQFVSDLYNYYKVVKNVNFQSMTVAMAAVAFGNEVTFRDKFKMDVSYVPYPMGPNVNTIQTVATGGGNQFVFPSTTSNLKEIVNIIADSLALWHESKEQRLTVNEMLVNLWRNNAQDEKNLNFIVKYRKDVEYDLFAGFKDMNSLVTNQVYLPITNGSTSVGSLVDSLGSLPQSILDSQYNNK
jgi:hypothetical protein